MLLPGLIAAPELKGLAFVLFAVCGPDPCFTNRI